MFVWLKLNGITDSNQLITTIAVEKKVLAVPGVVCGCTVLQANALC
jgi:aspartate/methionine/tyrosine aminotransferase